MQSIAENEQIEQIAHHIHEIIKLLGEDPSREGLKKTPMRAAKALAYITQGYGKTVGGVVGDAVFNYEGSKIITVKDIEFYSMCEHHILPFFGRMTVGYVPDKSIIGLSKLARIVDVWARRLQVQERLTRQVCDSVMEATGAKGVIVLCTAQHMCMKMRGVEKQDSSTTTLDYTGVFESQPELRDEYLRALNY